MHLKQFAQLALALPLLIAPYVSARSEPSDITVMFVRADENGDGVLDKAEVLIAALKHFSETDSDRDGALEKQEVGESAGEAEFTDNDTDKSGSLSVEEMIEEKLSDFSEVDTNKDGKLDFEEVTKHYEGKPE